MPLGGSPDVLRLTTPDPTLSRSFYSVAFGWAADDAVMTYVGGCVALITEPRPDIDPGLWVPTFVVSDMAAAARAATSNGGVDDGPLESPAAGRLLRDGEGVRFAISQRRASPQTMDAGVLAFLDLYSWNIPAALRVYTATLQAGEIAETIDGGAVYRLLVVNRRPVAGIVPGDAVEATPATPQWLPYFRVVDLEREVARMIDLGAQVRIPYTDTSLGEFAVLTDPVGVAFGLQTARADTLLNRTTTPGGPM